MNKLILSTLAFGGGLFLAAQVGLNAKLGVLLKSPFLAALATFSSSASISFLYVCFTVKRTPTFTALKEVPFYLWFTGGLCSVIGLGLYYYTIPKLGISTMVSLGLCGQIIFSVTAGHFGWFNLPVQEIGLKKMIGVVIMIIGVWMINNK